MNINDKLHGFTVERIRPLNELNGQLIEMKHDKTQLKLAWIKRSEENKTFGITFKTLPFDDTGVFHILEHSVLCGSDKYPVKEPFVELLKSSMNTFLNALTFPDKTMYPVSSRNEKDFVNLMRVYLDAVFCPLIYSKPEIFYQEGWHYEVDDNGDMSYKGVVFNEMKGALASADELEEIALNRALFPESPYRFVSGGDPKSIPDLSYDEFVDTHRKFYSPTNAYIFLDGDVDIEGTLNIINNEYLSKFDKGVKIDAPEMQKAVDSGTQELEFEIGEDENEQGKTRIAYGNIIGSFDEREKIIALQVLSDALCGSNQSLLSKKVLTSGLAEDIIMSVNDGIAQAWLKTEVRNIDDSNRDKVEELIFSELRALADNGIDHSQLEASMANLEFQMRERDFGSWPQGLIFGFQLMESWLYDGDPISNLEVGDLFIRLKEKMNNGYFEELINDVILNNPHKAKAILVPSHSAGEKRRKEESSRLEKEVSSMSDDDKAETRKRQEKLLEWQNSEDTADALATIPQLKLDDISAKPEELPTEIICSNDIKTLYHDINCSGIVNASLFFDASDLNENEICELSFLTDILGKMRTSAQSEEELDKNIRILFGELNFYVASHQIDSTPDKCRNMLKVSFGTLESNLEKAFRFTTELLTDTLFDNESTALDLLKQLKTRYFQQIVMSGSSIGMNRVLAQDNACFVSKEYAGGYEYYKWLSNQEKNWSWSELKEKLSSLLGRICVKSNLTLSITSDKKELVDTATKCISCSSLPLGEKKDKISVVKPFGKRREGIVIPADISFACAGGTLSDFNDYTGSMAIASKIISLVYLWNTIRVQGGAYGTGLITRRDGLTVSYSFRDPNAEKTLKAYDNIADFLDSFCESTEDITGFIIGAVSSASPLLTPKAKGNMADDSYWNGLTYEDRCKTLREMLGTTPTQIKEFSKQIRSAFETGGVCVIGSREQLDKCELDNISSL